jgi:hypothetical protein
MADFPYFPNDQEDLMDMSSDETIFKPIHILNSYFKIISKEDLGCWEILSEINTHAKNGDFNLVQRIYYRTYRLVNSNQLLQIELYIARMYDEAGKIRDAIAHFIKFLIKYYNCTCNEAIGLPNFTTYARLVSERVLRKYEKNHQIYNAIRVYKYMIKYCKKSTDMSLFEYKQTLIERRDLVEQESIFANWMLDSKRKIIREGLNTLINLENNPYNMQLLLKYWSPMTNYYNPADLDYVMEKLSIITPTSNPNPVDLA